MTDTDRVLTDFARLKVVIDDDLATRTGNWHDDIDPWIDPTVMANFAAQYAELTTESYCDRDDNVLVDDFETAHALSETIYFSFIRGFLFGARFRAAADGHRKP